MLKNILCVAAGAVVGAGVTAVFGANIVTKSVEKKKELGNKYIPDDILSDMIDEIEDIDELKEYVIKLKKALMEDDEIEMEKILVELSKFEPTKQTETVAADEDDFIIDPEIQAMLDGMDIKLSEIFEGLNQQYEDISDKINFICNLFTEEDDAESDEDDESGEEWKEIEVQEESSQEVTLKESDTEASPEPATESVPDPEQKDNNKEQVTHESVISKMTETVINPLCSKYGEDLRKPLEASVCKLVDCGDDNVVAAYLKKFTSAVRSSRGSKKQIQKYIAEIKKLPESTPETAE